MDAQGKKFLEALRQHLDSISDDEFYARLKKNSQPHARGQLLDDFLDNPFAVDVDASAIQYSVVYEASGAEPKMPANEYEDNDEFAEAA